MKMTEALYKTSRSALANDFGNESLEDLKEFRNYLRERWETEFAVAEHNGGIHQIPANWIQESQLLYNRTYREIEKRMYAYACKVSEKEALERQAECGCPARK